MTPTADDRLAAPRQGDVLLVEDTGFEVQVMRSQESLLPYRNSDAAGARPLPGSARGETIVHRPPRAVTATGAYIGHGNTARGHANTARLNAGDLKFFSAATATPWSTSGSMAYARKSPASC